ncbi:Integrator complex subunit 3, N-terminal, partial [Dillenia turbinata]
MARHLIEVATLEAPNQLELSLRQNFELLESQLRPPLSLQIPSPEQYSNLNFAILFGVLTEPHFAQVHMKHLHALVVDGYEFFTDTLIRVVNELYQKLVVPVRPQLVWVTSVMINVSAIGVDKLLVCLLRQIVGGDYSEGNLWLCSELCSLLLTTLDCILHLEEPFILTSALYTYLRLVGDHYRLASTNPQMKTLTSMEIDFCVKVLRTQFHLCIKIGRDLIRLLQDLFHIPWFRDIWKDLMLRPSEFGISGFTDISKIYSLRTSSRYFLLRITPEMETQLRFLLTHVKWGSQKRYQAWFGKKFLCGPDRETLICDMVRFICCAHHPPNEIIQSDVIQRWAIIGWLLKSCRKNYVVANVKLALFYDWLFFDERVDNIMNIEPAMLLMVYSIPNYIDMTHMLLEFLFLLVDNFDVERKTMLVQGVSSAFSTLVRKGVISSLDVLASCDALSPFLREKLRSFSRPEICRDLPTVPHSVKHLKLSSPLRLGSPTPSSQELRVSTLSSKVVADGKPGEDSVRIAEEAVASCSPVIRTCNSLDEMVKDLGDTIGKSYTVGLQMLEKTLYSFANLDDLGLESAYVLDPEAFSCKITKIFEVNGHKLFDPLEFSFENDSYDEMKSATAIIIRSFVFSQHDRMKGLLLFWARNDFPVGACFISYASRIAQEANLVGYDKPTVESDHAAAALHGIPFLQFHANGCFSSMDGWKMGSSEDLDPASHLDAELISKLLDGVFAAYRHFLILRNALGSLYWKNVEQHQLWALIRSELAVSSVPVQKLILRFFSSMPTDPSVISIPVGGLLSLCSCRAPSPELVGAILLLPDNTFEEFAAAALSAWVVSNASMLFESLGIFLGKLYSNNGNSVKSYAGPTVINRSALFWLLNNFDAQVKGKLQPA